MSLLHLTHKQCVITNTLKPSFYFQTRSLISLLRTHIKISTNTTRNDTTHQINFAMLYLLFALAFTLLLCPVFSDEVPFCRPVPCLPAYCLPVDCRPVSCLSVPCLPAPVQARSSSPSNIWYGVRVGLLLITLTSFVLFVAVGAFELAKELKKEKRS